MYNSEGFIIITSSLAVVRERGIILTSQPCHGGSSRGPLSVGV